MSSGDGQSEKSGKEEEPEAKDEGDDDTVRDEKEDEADKKESGGPEEKTNGASPKENAEEDSDREEEEDACSEDTEGPEEGLDEDPSALKLSAYMNEADFGDEGEAIFHHHRIPKSLLAAGEVNDDSDDDEEEEDEGKEAERSNARLFVEKLREGLDSIVAARGSVEMDHRIQQFASKFCHGS